MRLAHSLVSLSLFAGLAALIGCAAEGVSDGPVEEQLASAPDEDAGEGTRMSLPPTAPSTDDDPTDTDDPPAGKDGGTTSTKDGGTTPTTPVNKMCAPAKNTCAAAVDLGAISGDDGADTKSAKGTGSQWFKVRLTEDVFGGASMRFKAKLTAPAGENFDLYLYLPASDTRECSKATKVAKTANAVESASFEYGESFGGNGVDDDRTISIEVRHVDGACSATAEWTLDVFGNTL